MQRIIQKTAQSARGSSSLVGAAVFAAGAGSAFYANEQAAHCDKELADAVAAAAKATAAAAAATSQLATLMADSTPKPETRFAYF